MDRKIIIGYDGSEHGDDALALGALLAGALDARPLVATAVVYPDYLVPLADLELAAQEHAAPLFERAAQRMAPLEIETRTPVDNSPGHALHELAETEDATLIVLGSAHRGSLGRILLGSTGEALLSGAPCAVAVAPHGFAGRPDRQLARIGVAVDGSTESLSALRVAASLAKRPEASLELITVAPPAAPDIGGAMLSMLSREELERAVNDEMAAALDRAVAAVPADLQPQRKLLHGDPATVLAEAAQELDLLIVGSRCYGPLRRALLGGVSAKLMRSAPAPLLVMPHGRGAEPFEPQ